MKTRHGRTGRDKMELKMTAMIDIVFLLLIFFVMTFTVVAPEGDFNLQMPLVKASPAMNPAEPPLPPVRIRLIANDSGHLSSIHMGERDLGRSFKALNMEIRQIVGDSSGPGRADDVEVEIDADYGLRFEHVMDAITQVSGYVGENNQIFKVCEKIKFAPPRKPQ